VAVDGITRPMQRSRRSAVPAALTRTHPAGPLHRKEAQRALSAAFRHHELDPWPGVNLALRCRKELQQPELDAAYLHLVKNQVRVLRS
jgi:hypothetical protein